MADDHERRLQTVEAKLQEMEALVNLALRLLAVERPLSALLARFGATEREALAVHTLLEDVLKRAQAGGIYAPSFVGFHSDLVKVFPAVKGDREFVSLLLDTLKLDRPSYRQLHAYATAQGWPQ